VGIGGAVGSVSRYLIALAIPGDAGLAISPLFESFPFATLAVNVIGSLLLGLVTTITAVSGAQGNKLRLLLGTGLCGGFTTYSTFALEIDRLLIAAQFWLAFWYIALSLLLGGLAAYLGIWLGSKISGNWNRRV